jgi:hypothetical protein
MTRALALSVRDVLLQGLDTAFDKKSWHGTTLLGAVRGVDARTAARRVHGRRSVWEQVLHAAYWKHRVLNKIAGPSRFPRQGSDWPKLPDPPDAASWRADVELLRDIQRRLRAAVEALPAAKLRDAQVVWLTHGAAAHDLYHAGQIKLLLRLIADASRQ